MKRTIVRQPQYHTALWRRAWLAGVRRCGAAKADSWVNWAALEGSEMKLPRSIKRILYIVGLIIFAPLALISVFAQLLHLTVFIPGFGAEINEFSPGVFVGMCGMNFMFLCIAGYSLQELRGEE